MREDVLFRCSCSLLVAPTDKIDLQHPAWCVCACVCVCVLQRRYVVRHGGPVMFRFYETITTTIMNEVPDRSPRFFFSKGASMTSGCVLAAPRPWSDGWQRFSGEKAGAGPLACPITTAIVSSKHSIQCCRYYLRTRESYSYLQEAAEGASTTNQRMPTLSSVCTMESWQLF